LTDVSEGESSIKQNRINKAKSIHQGTKQKQHHGEATNEGYEGCCPQEVGHEAPHESQEEINKRFVDFSQWLRI
jgi:hypothetical protein